jgi:hypothetical protein
MHETAPAGETRSMGESIGLVAAKTSLKAFEGAVFKVWPRWDRIGEARELPDWPAFADYTEEEQGPHEVVGFYEDGSWSVLAESSPTRMEDEANLSALSELVGPVVCVWIETHGGCAAWQYYEASSLVREVATMDAPTTQKGAARPEERGIDVESFYADEAWQVWSAFGLKSPYEVRGVRAVTFDDRDAMDALAAMPSRTKQDGKEGANASPQPERQGKKPWWRLW